MNKPTYTCATKGCGNPINFLEVDAGTWRHTKTGSRYCEVGHLCFAHPAGGTNTTPPEELERDVTELHEILEYVGDYCDADAGQVSDLSRKIRAYATSVAQERVEEATADLREQLDRALVPKFKVGDRVRTLNHGICVITGERAVVVMDDDGTEYAQMEEGLSLAPLETECQHLKGHTPQNFGPFVHYAFCPRCGESLTKEGEA